ncbi:hypothetical protein N657DRAFT_314527 [Parathielavia appendiculata]|uniref:Uncharacterized protein n=1 Tax=Parathielavia appendiculata TaxID=2587402 RepID=A0AAN6Z694_9PEZI|nr:hypothetical protein N657DRAFT_314527 [Parathielavia appendiculata]
MREECGEFPEGWHIVVGQQNDKLTTASTRAAEVKREDRYECAAKLLRTAQNAWTRESQEKAVASFPTRHWYSPHFRTNKHCRLLSAPAGRRHWQLRHVTAGIDLSSIRSVFLQSIGSAQKECAGWPWKTRREVRHSVLDPRHNGTESADEALEPRSICASEREGFQDHTDQAVWSTASISLSF